MGFVLHCFNLYLIEVTTAYVADSFSLHSSPSCHHEVALISSQFIWPMNLPNLEVLLSTPYIFISNKYFSSFTFSLSVASLIIFLIFLSLLQGKLYLLLLGTTALSLVCQLLYALHWHLSLYSLQENIYIWELRVKLTNKVIRIFIYSNIEKPIYF